MENGTNNEKREKALQDALNKFEKLSDKNKIIALNVMDCMLKNNENQNHK